MKTLIDKFEKEKGCRPYCYADATYGELLNEIIKNSKKSPKADYRSDCIQPRGTIPTFTYYLFQMNEKKNPSHLKLEESIGTEGAEQFWANLVGMGKNLRQSL